MATEDMESSGTGRRVADNVRRLREARGLSLRALAAEVRKVGGTLSADAINKIENGRTLPPGIVPPKQVRRVDADDVVALALALEVNPLTLLMPEEATNEPVNLTSDYTVTGRTAWQWGLGRRPAMDWEPGIGVSFAEPGADPAIALENEERDQEFGRRRAEYMRLALPPELRRAGDNPLVRLAQQLEELMVDIVASPGDRTDRARWARMAQRRVQQLKINLEEYTEMLEHDGADDLERLGLLSRSKMEPQ